MRALLPIALFFLFVTGVFLFFHSPARIQRLKTCRGCNLVIITIDSLRADRLPCFGYAYATATSLCKFAYDNVIFHKTYANSSWTLPNEMSLFTGLYPTSHGIKTTLKDKLNPAVDTLSKVLSSKGYVTTFVSNNQPNVSPEQFGQNFTNIRITPDPLGDAVNTWLTVIDSIKIANVRRQPAFVFFHTDQIHDYQNLITSIPASFPLDPSYHPPLLNYLFDFTPTVAQLTRDWIELNANRRAGQALQKQYVTWREQLIKTTGTSMTEKIFHELPAYDQKIILAKSAAVTLADRDNKTLVTLAQHLYDESIRRADPFIGQVLARLAWDNLLRNTIVVITSEHGELLGEADLLGHSTILLEPETHIPLIMHIPGIQRAQFSDLVQTIDIYPTVLDLLGIPLPHTAPGTSLKNLVTGAPNYKKNAYVISQWTSNENNRSILTDRWHLIEAQPTKQSVLESKLYNIIQDPKEQDNVAKLYPDVVDSLRKTLNETLTSQPKYPPVDSSFPDWLDEKGRQRLIQTGYFF